MPRPGDRRSETRKPSSANRARAVCIYARNIQTLSSSSPLSWLDRLYFFLEKKNYILFHHSIFIIIITFLLPPSKEKRMKRRRIKEREEKWTDQRSNERTGKKTKEGKKRTKSRIETMIIVDKYFLCGTDGRTTVERRAQRGRWSALFRLSDLSFHSLFLRWFVKRLGPIVRHSPGHAAGLQLHADRNACVHSSCSPPYSSRSSRCERQIEASRSSGCKPA